jgi:hypothetical protein
LKKLFVITTKIWGVMKSILHVLCADKVSVEQNQAQIGLKQMRDRSNILTQVEQFILGTP